MGQASKTLIPTLNLFLVLGATSVLATNYNESSTPSLRKLDEEKCNTCQTIPPPPPPSSPPPSPLCPPPPAPVLPPPAPKKPPSSYFPPPPPSGSIYITGPPGSLYPIDNDFGGGHRKVAVGLPALISSGLVGLLGFLLFGN